MLEERLKEISKQIESLQEEVRRQKRNEHKPIDDFGELVRAQRKAQKITIAELALLTQLSTVTIRKIEQGKKSVSIENLEKVIGTLGMNLWIK